MKTFIDFGAGNKWYDKRVKYAKFSPDWHTIAIDMDDEPKWNFIYDEWIVDSFANDIKISKIVDLEDPWGSTFINNKELIAAYAQAFGALNLEE